MNELQAKLAALLMEYSFYLKAQLTGKLYVFRLECVADTYLLANEQRGPDT